LCAHCCAPSAPHVNMAQVAADIGIAISVTRVLLQHADTIAGVGVARTPISSASVDITVVEEDGPVKSSRRAIPSIRSTSSQGAPLSEAMIMEALAASGISTSPGAL